MIHESRRTLRRQVSEGINVLDMVAEQMIGQLSNISENGMLLLSPASLVDNALYQLRFQLSDLQGRLLQIDVGVHLLWSRPARGFGQLWAGFRFLTVSDEHRQYVRRWVNAGH
ncbi:PilZ domain-containing protein [Xylella taiwanensis]|uniref:PilZ domain-containing protein n=1 Tax=Xylella taiwanensis TaxID=1444770 RepID=Z9JIJ3_9GAMM|nr:PilZ domain-containing protein [Xylella taiwanensis]AXI83862.1 pilus assembly protein PilZ [Xylella taiwanensis]EWS77636.1 pilZ family protein [Xylella taiwanensis]MCD8456967.1 PilZ domain-containing protein [Xylella taiwanensis]MCD8459378.1 PilZ domain-containing protein [Xylella taiwanensis]MCD8461751.1 PilZ domain-containing protein [Xylella taiwanensis]